MIGVKSLRVLHVNFSAPGGSAGRVVGTLLDTTERLGHTVNLAGSFSPRDVQADPRTVPVAIPHNRWQTKLFRNQAKRGFANIASAALVSLLNDPVFDKADIVHLHRMSDSYFSYLLLPFLTAKPTVWTFHDAAVYTGGCRCVGSCQEWRDDWCAKCPQAKAADARPLRRDLMQLLKAAITKIADFTAVCPSARLLEQSRLGILKGHEAKFIRHGVDTGVYRPGDRAEVRKRLGLPDDRIIILNIAQDEVVDEAAGQCLREALAKLPCREQPPLLLDLAVTVRSSGADWPIPAIRRPVATQPAALAEYYRAADLFVSSAVTDGFDLSVAEAMACGVPVVAFAGGGASEIMIHRLTGYLANKDSEDLARGIAGYLEDAAAGQSAGSAGRARIEELFTAADMAAAYLSLYEEMLIAAGGLQVTVWVKEKLPRLLERARPTDWQGVWSRFDELYSRFGQDEVSERNVFVDEYLSVCLKHADPAANTVWEIIQVWYIRRHPPAHCGGLNPEEREALLDFCQLLREKIRTYFEHNSIEEMPALDQQQQLVIISAWKKVFFDYSSILNLRDPAQYAIPQKPFGNDDRPGLFERMLSASMDHPFDADAYPLTAGNLRDAPIPLFGKIILAYWLANTPYFNLEERHRQKLLACLPALCRMELAPVFFTHFVTEILNDLWRASYIGGDNLAALSCFGDFITRHMERFLPQYAKAAARTGPRRSNGKIRVGYVSRLFYRQAVSFYMVNRIIHHDREKFEIHIFALGERQDDMTDLFKQHCDHFTRLADMHNIGSIAAHITASQLDILIYTDIGMDPMTYMLAGLRLAPVQCALAGHGTSTGMPKIDYYISGDFEPPDADAHYRETLVRLPNLGAAQYPPPFAENIGCSRKEWKLPDEIVVFVSCANGLKHVPARDDILMEILQKAPGACIILKPYFSAQEGDIFTRRVMGRAKEAGVADRLFIIPPLGRVEAVLAIADVQLDTYPYGGWTTNLEALYMGLPLVTQEGGQARSRWGAHMLRALGISEGIARDAQEYVAWAVRFAADADLRARVKRRIEQTARAVFFDGTAAQAAYEAVLIGIHKGGGSE